MLTAAKSGPKKLTPIDSMFEAEIYGLGVTKPQFIAVPRPEMCSMLSASLSLRHAGRGEWEYPLWLLCRPLKQWLTGRKIYSIIAASKKC